MNELWVDFIESDVSLMVARVSRYFGINPLYFIEEEVDDRYQQLQILEAMMVRDQVFEREMAEQEREESESRQRIQTSLSAPGAQERVAPPSAQEVMAMIDAGEQ